jgi:hypothetical protein
MNRNQTARHDLLGVVEAQKVAAEQRQALRREISPSGARRPDRPAHDAQHCEQDQRGEPEAPGNRHRRRHHAELPFDGDPGGTPDQNG